MAAYTSTSKLPVSDDGTQIYADARGNPNLPAIVFLHGFALSSICFDGVFSDPKWFEHVYLIRYDARGHGRSGKPVSEEAYQSKREAEDFLAVIKAFGVKKAFFAGWSLGTTVVADICAYPGPSVLHGIISLAGIPYIGLVNKLISDYVGTLFPGLITTNDVALSIKTAEEFVDSLVTHPEALPYRTRQAWLGDVMSVPPAIRAYNLTREQDSTAFITQGGAALHHLLVQGTEDRLRGKVQILEDELREVFGDRSTVQIFEGVGHATFLESPDEVREVVLQWASAVLRG